eukprot:29024-Pelagococcus_subviridis.AAC.14
MATLARRLPGGALRGGFGNEHSAADDEETRAAAAAAAAAAPFPFPLPLSPPTPPTTSKMSLRTSCTTLSGGARGASLPISSQCSSDASADIVVEDGTSTVSVPPAARARRKNISASPTPAFDPPRRKSPRPPRSPSSHESSIRSPAPTEPNGVALNVQRGARATSTLPSPRRPRRQRDVRPRAVDLRRRPRVAQARPRRPGRVVVPFGHSVYAERVVVVVVVVAGGGGAGGVEDAAQRGDAQAVRERHERGSRRRSGGGFRLLDLLRGRLARALPPPLEPPPPLRRKRKSRARARVPQTLRAAARERPPARPGPGPGPVAARLVDRATQRVAQPSERPPRGRVRGDAVDLLALERKSRRPPRVRAPSRPVHRHERGPPFAIPPRSQSLQRARDRASRVLAVVLSRRVVVEVPERASRRLDDDERRAKAEPSLDPAPRASRRLRVRVAEDLLIGSVVGTGTSSSSSSSSSSSAASIRRAVGRVVQRHSVRRRRRVPRAASNLRPQRAPRRARVLRAFARRGQDGELFVVAGRPSSERSLHVHRRALGRRADAEVRERDLVPVRRVAVVAVAVAGRVARDVFVVVRAVPLRVAPLVVFLAVVRVVVVVVVVDRRGRDRARRRLDRRRLRVAVAGVAPRRAAAVRTRGRVFERLGFILLVPVVEEGRQRPLGHGAAGGPRAGWTDERVEKTRTPNRGLDSADEMFSPVVTASERPPPARLARSCELARDVRLGRPRADPREDRVRGQRRARRPFCRPDLARSDDGHPRCSFRPSRSIDHASSPSSVPPS